jgi:hypothetical protein
MISFWPKNKTAQLSYHGIGNPPASHPSTAVGNFYPGLEFNFLNVWKRIFVGIELLESSGEVIAVQPGEARDAAARRSLQKLKDSAEENSVYLTQVDYRPPQSKVRRVKLLRYVTGPTICDPDPSREDPEADAAYFLEWPNALGHMHHLLGGRGIATCHFVVVEEGDEKKKKERTFTPLRVKLAVRSLIDEGTGLISRRTTEPGEITESLCSPWQTDYIGCACFYWASNRPDFVNAEEVPVRPSDGTQAEDVHYLGHHWLDVPLDAENRVQRDAQGRIRRSRKRVVLKDGTKTRKPFYTLQRKWDGGPLLKHEDVMKDWESKLEFVIGGKDTPDGVVPTAPEDPPTPDRIGAGPGLQGSVRVDGGEALCDEPDAATGREARDRTRATRRVARRRKASRRAKRKKS